MLGDKSCNKNFVGKVKNNENNWASQKQLEVILMNADIYIDNTIIVKDCEYLFQQ